MEMIPKALILGMFAAVQPSTTPVVTPDKINRIWNEVATREGYRQLQLAGDGSAGNFLGASPDDGVTIQLPLIQVRNSIQIDVSHAGEEAQFVTRTIGTVLGISQFFNLGVKLVYHAAAPDNDGRGFVLHRVLSKSEDDLSRLQRGGEFWVGAKYAMGGPDASEFRLSVEPWLADNRYVFIDLDTSFPGAFPLDSIRDRVRDVGEYATGPMKGFLDSAESGF